MRVVVVVIVTDCDRLHCAGQSTDGGRVQTEGEMGSTVIMMLRLKAVLYPCAFATRPDVAVHDANHQGAGRSRQAAEAAMTSKRGSRASTPKPKW